MTIVAAGPRAKVMDRVMFEELLRRIPAWVLVDAREPKVLPATFTRRTTASASATPGPDPSAPFRR
ncbi:hypothetical protein FAIPA1_210003 [Frankia sp. AiPs1]|uniref:hypothetical protein n=1 Tax=Frankia sp. AiPa1 TaxID=573492 RepID=UPI00202B412C|nr:hypothetical protein [Frankia sp. AiPa1]MCL9758893.1 hypothetical protein [Frankia sp. AiPa1]